MLTKTSIAIALTLVLAATGVSAAATINDQLTSSQVNTFCEGKSVGEEVKASATVAGAFVSGTVQCTSSDVSAPPPMANQAMNSYGGDDDGDSEDHSEGQGDRGHDSDSGHDSHGDNDNNSSRHDSDD
ncbi:MAG: hypothetical protein KKF33_01110 [Alphaproteobacteria bacterium]|nr:hypothetical protein [Alphaproteobacteria bacterium]